MISRAAAIVLVFIHLGFVSLRSAEPRIWLTHQSGNPQKITVNWESAEPGDSIVNYGTGHKPNVNTLEYGKAVGGPETLHHLEIDVPDPDAVYRYVIGQDETRLPEATFKTYPTHGEFRAVIVGDLHANIKPVADAILKDDPHLLLTAGDNVPSLHEPGKERIKIFDTLIDSAPELFRRIPILPVLGNHDKEAHPRGPKPPAEPVYDIDAKAFHEFFPTPGDHWKWAFDIPEFSVRFIALDLQHIQDFGTTWQTCHAFAPGSEQFEWYKKTMAENRAAFVFTINNEISSSMRRQAGGEWGKMFRMGSALITGFGTFAERAEWDGFPCFNTHAHGHGDIYKDPNSSFLSPEGGYLLLTFKHGEDKMTLQIKNQKGDVLDTRVISKIAR